jgi:hypothetical protein
VTWQLLAAAGKDGWCLSADFLYRFLLAYFFSFPPIAPTMRMVVVHPHTQQQQCLNAPLPLLFPSAMLEILLLHLLLDQKGGFTDGRMTIMN